MKIKKYLKSISGRKQLAKDLGTHLSGIHTHGELCTTDEIVYREKDIIKLFKHYGFPKPIWNNGKK